MTENVSIRPSEMVEGGAIPVDQNLAVTEARFCLFDYGGKAPPTTAAKLVLLSDEGVEHTQYYSASDPSRFIPGQDGKGLVPVGTANNLSKSSNFSVLMTNMVNAGFPENKLGNDLSVMDGLYAYWIGVPEPKRSGLTKAEDQARERVILVPSQIHNLPWEKKSAPKASSKANGKAAAESDDSDASAEAIELIGRVVAESGSATRQDIAVRVFKDLADSPNRDKIATLIFSPDIQAKLVAAGFGIEGETISKEGK